MSNISTLFGQAFNAAEVEPSQPYSLLPRGRYVVSIDDSAMKATNNGSGQYLECRFRVLDGECQGATAYSRFNLVNNNTIAQEIAFREFSSLCRAVGVLQVADSSELHDRPLVIQVDLEVRKDKNKQIVYDEEGQPKHSNVIKGYFSINDDRPPPAPATAAPRPAAPMPPPAAQRATTAKPGAPAAPWKRSA